MKREIWKSIAGYKGFYEASNIGQIRRACKTKFNPKHSIVKQGISSFGYYGCYFYKNGREKLCSVARLVLSAFAGQCPEGMEASHLNDIKTDNRWPENLAWMTPSENKKLGFVNHPEVREHFRKPKSPETRKRMSISAKRRCQKTKLYFIIREHLKKAI